MNKPYGLILAGGGAKGAYQIGAWKALRELNIKFLAIAGVSIGAINGALIAMDAFKESMELWNSITVEKGVNIETELKDPDNLFSSKNYTAIFREFIKNGGIDASPAQELLSGYIDEEKIREGKIIYGLVTCQLSTTLKPLELFLDDIPEGKLVDYIFASAKFPGVSKIGPEGEKFLDGGAYDNAPVSMLKKLGINRLIVIDISSIKGYGHEDDFTNSEIIYIRPHNIDDIGASFDFNPEMIEHRMKMGYMDTMKAFGEYAGNIYYFKPKVFKNLVAKYGPEAVYQLEELAYELKVPRLNLYKQKDFMISLKKAYEIHKIDDLLEVDEKKDKEQQKPGFISSIINKLTHFTNKEKDFSLAIEIIENF